MVAYHEHRAVFLLRLKLFGLRAFAVQERPYKSAQTQKETAVRFGKRYVGFVDILLGSRIFIHTFFISNTARNVKAYTP